MRSKVAALLEKARAKGLDTVAWDKRLADRASKRDYWDPTSQVFFSGGHGWGVAQDGATVCLGAESEVLAYLNGESMPKRVTGAAMEVLEKIKERQENERRETTFATQSSHKLGAFKERYQRIRPAPGVKHRATHIKRLKV